MRKLALVAALLLFAGLAHAYDMGGYKEEAYKLHKHTLYIKLHWNMASPDKDTLVAEGFVEPFRPGEGLRAVRLELVGLDDNGKVVNSAEGLTRDNYIESPFYPASPFKIALKLNGKEKAFTITGSFYHYERGRKGRSEHLDYIPVMSR